MLEPGTFKSKPLATIGDESAEVTYAAVGKALSRWESADFRMAGLFSVLIGIPSPVPAIRAYGAVATFQVRQQMVRAAADSFFNNRPNQELRQKVEDIFKRHMNDAAVRRAEIAHGIVINTNPTRRRLHHFLAPPYYATKKRDHKANPSYLYSSVEIAAFTTGFEDLAIHIYEVAHEVIGWHKSSQK
jgi:hypothetical protein